MDVRTRTRQYGGPVVAFEGQNRGSWLVFEVCGCHAGTRDYYELAMFLVEPRSALGSDLERSAALFRRAPVRSMG